MTITPHSAEIEQIVVRTFQQFGANVEGPLDLDSSARVDDGRIIARTYRAGQFMAMWLMDVGLLQFYDAAGHMLRTVNLFERAAPVKMAA